MRLREHELTIPSSPLPQFVPAEIVRRGFCRHLCCLLSCCPNGDLSPAGLCVAGMPLWCLPVLLMLNGYPACRGTLPYMAPELVSNPDRVSEKADVWSLGMVRLPAPDSCLRMAALEVPMPLCSSSSVSGVPRLWWLTTSAAHTIKLHILCPLAPKPGYTWLLFLCCMALACQPVLLLCRGALRDQL